MKKNYSPIIELKYDPSNKGDVFIVTNIILLVISAIALISVSINLDTQYWFVFLLGLVGVVASLTRIKNFSRFKNVALYDDHIVVNGIQAYKKSEVDFSLLKPNNFNGGFTVVGIFISKQKSVPWQRCFP